MNSQLSIFKGNLSKKPYCSDQLDQGLIVRSIEHAITKRHIQPNHPNSKLWLLYDIDRPTSPEELTDDFHLPAPHIWAQNPKNGHAHALYGLETPVHLNENSSREAIRFAGAVDCALSSAMSSDAGYAGLICKNPLHPDWRVWTCSNDHYALHELADYVDLTPYKDRRKNLPAIGLGRNCTVFDQLRKWAYKAIRQGWPAYDQWLNACIDRVSAYNIQFGTPLDRTEILAIAKSVAKWTHRNMSFASFQAYIDRTHTPEIQAKRAVKGAAAAAKVKRSKTEKAITEAIETLQAQNKRVSTRAVAEIAGVGQSTAARYLKVTH